MADQVVTSPGRSASAGRTRRPLGWVVCLVLLAAVVAATARGGAWFVPFIAGVGAGIASLHWRRMALLATAASVVGWAIPLWGQALRGLPIGATARAIAGLAGLPPYAGSP